MQDNNLHIDKSFTDRAWKEMSSMLDQEMPITKKKRRFLIWWFTGGLALAASLIGIWLTASSPEEIQVQETQLSDIQNPDTPDQQTSFALTEKENGASDSNHSQLPPTPPSKPQHSTQTPIVKPFQNASASINEIANEKSAEIEKVIQPQPIAENDKPIVKRVLTPNLLATNDLNALTIHSSVSLIVPIEKIKKNRIQLITEGSAYFTSKSNAGGLGASMLVSIPIKKSKFSIETGLGYSHLSQPLSYSLELTQDDNSVETVEAVTDIAYGNSNIFKNTTSFEYNSISLPTERLNLHYLQLPVSLSYRLKRFRFHGGLQTSLLLTSTGSPLKGGVFQFAVEPGNDPLGTPPTLNDPSSLSSSSFQKLSDFELAAMAGFGFDFSPKFGVNLSYQNGFTDVIKSNTKKDYNQLLRLSMRYTW